MFTLKATVSDKHIGEVLERLKGVADTVKVEFTPGRRWNQRRLARSRTTSAATAQMSSQRARQAPRKVEKSVPPTKQATDKRAKDTDIPGRRTGQPQPIPRVLRFFRPAKSAP